MVSQARLIEATDGHFAWMLGEAPPPARLSLPPGGVDEACVLRWLRRNLARFGQPGNWLVVAEGEVVGLCSHKTAPSADGAVEIGYAVAAERRRLGHATQAVSLLIRAARRDPRIRRLVAETAVGNLPSQRVLEANGFAKTGTGVDADEGDMIVWALELAEPTALSPELFERRFDALYVTAEGRIVCTNEWDRRPAPRFHLMLTATGPLIRFRRDVPADLARELTELAASATWDPSAQSPPALLARCVAALSRHEPVHAVWSGPAFAALRVTARLGPTLEIGPENDNLLRGRFDAWLEDVPHRRPFIAVVHDAKAVSTCASVRISPAAHCAGVETHPEHRRRGHALELDGFGSTRSEP
jgi:RimJ/RimL family protein N-acetyltransferase